MLKWEGNWAVICYFMNLLVACVYIWLNLYSLLWTFSCSRQVCFTDVLRKSIQNLFHPCIKSSLFWPQETISLVTMSHASVYCLTSFIVLHNRMGGIHWKRLWSLIGEMLYSIFSRKLKWIAKDIVRYGRSNLLNL